MKQDKKVNAFLVFHEDVKKMSNEQLEATLKELRDLTVTISNQTEKPQSIFRRRAA